MGNIICFSIIKPFKHWRKCFVLTYKVWKWFGAFHNGPEARGNCKVFFRAKLSPTAVVQRSVDVPSHPSACCRVLVLTYTNICNFTANFVTILSLLSTKYYKYIKPSCKRQSIYEGWNFNSGNYLFTTDTK